MEIKIPVPRKKKRRRTDYSFGPFPIPIPSGTRRWNCYTGKLQGHHVVVEHSGDAYDLYTRGCFGKGTLSRSLPEFERFQPTIDIPKDDKILQLKIMVKNRYTCHLNWKRSVLNDDLNMLDDFDFGSGEEEEVEDEEEEEEGEAEEDTSTEETGQTNKPIHDGEEEESQDKSNSDLNSSSNQNEKTEEKVKRLLHPLCEIDEVKADVFVVNARHHQEQQQQQPPPVQKDQNSPKNPKQWLPTLKKDPYPIRENLLLTFEEAFFLTYGLGCLLVKDNNDKPMNITEMWKTFHQQREDFLPKYIAYHYYRSRGWIPKPGLKFGAEYILYKEGQYFYHATYSTLVSMVEENSLKKDPNLYSRKLDWVTLAGLDRMNEHVAKKLLFCYVIKPKDIYEEELLSPKCISRFKVQEMIVSRWVSSQDRMKKTDNIIEEFP